jgi:hypothetical protein
MLSSELKDYILLPKWLLESTIKELNSYNSISKVSTLEIESIDFNKLVKIDSYHIFTDTYDKGVFCYTLVKNHKNITEVLIIKTLYNEIDFNNEISILKKCFNIK